MSPWHLETNSDRLHRHHRHDSIARAIAGPDASLLDFEVEPEHAHTRHRPVVCAVCGGIIKVCTQRHNQSTSLEVPAWMLPILVKGKPEYLEWEPKPRPGQISHKSWYENSYNLIRVITPTAFIGGSQGMKVGDKILHIDTRDPLMKIPLHGVCFRLVHIFCEDQFRFRLHIGDPNGGAPSTLPHFYTIWRQRAIASDPGGLMTHPILEGNDYFGDLSFMQGNMQLYYAYIQEQEPLYRRLLAHPMKVPSLTDVVVSANLQTLDGRERNPCIELANLYSRIQNVLPLEIREMVYTAMEPFYQGHGPPLAPTRVLPPQYWKARLFSGELIPWLFDLRETDLLDYRCMTFYGTTHDSDIAGSDWEQGRDVYDEDMWDWEFLCRQLAQSNVFEEGGLLEGKPDNLYNRHRIWKLLEAARLGHVKFRDT
ncbi:hypothetical protein F4808DRAFT_426803 [Astrocystis sublimbata]|nr:hypothetical protein F4808DRAFT_426803 [Astrocystis sublimbata]